MYTHPPYGRETPQVSYNWLQHWEKAGRSAVGKTKRLSVVGDARSRNGFLPGKESAFEKRYVSLRRLSALELETVEVARPIAAVDVQRREQRQGEKQVDRNQQQGQMAFGFVAL